MMQRVDVYWSHNSPYCYLALDRILALRRRHDIHVVLRLVLPGLMRHGGRFADASVIEQAYFLHDAARTADFLGASFAWPRAWPVAFVGDNLYRAAPEQPRAWRIYHLNAAALEQGRGWDLIDQVSRLIWDGSTENWQEDAILGPAVERAGLDYAALCRRADEGATPLRRTTLITTMRFWPRATGACRSSSSKASPSTARIASTSSSGGLIRPGEPVEMTSPGSWS